MQQMQIQGTEIQIKEYQGKRVVTLKDVDAVHQRKPGTASRNFNQNRNRFIEDIDFFRINVTDNEIRSQFGISPNAGGTVILITETGYLMLVKSFTDDLAWKVQRELVDSYFRARAEPDEQCMQEIIESGVPTVIVATDKLIRCAEIMAGCLDSNRPYVLNILKNIVPNIDNEEEPKVTDKFEITAKTDEPKRKPSDFLPKSVSIDTTKMLLEMSEQNMDLPTLARKAAVSVAAIMSWIKGSHKPMEQSRKNICAALGKDENFLTPKRKRNVRE